MLCSQVGCALTRSDKISKDNLEKRRVALEKWLNLCVPNNVSRSFNYFRDFIRLKKVRIDLILIEALRGVCEPLWRSS